MSTPVSAENLAFAQDVLDKRFELYSWCEQKINTLATVNSIVLGALFAIAGTAFKADTIVRKLEFGLTAGLVGTAMLIVLWHVEPTMRSGTLAKGSKNLRSVVGVHNHATKDAYHDAVLAATPEDIFRSTTDQIVGMNKNIWKNQRAIRWAVALDILGLIMFAITVSQASFTPDDPEKKSSTFQHVVYSVKT